MSKIPPPKEANVTPIEETIQRLMEPDKHGEKGDPARCAAFNDCFGHPVQRTLDALWKFAETSSARVSELEAENQRLRSAMDRYSEDEILNPKR